MSDWQFSFVYNITHLAVEIDEILFFHLLGSSKHSLVTKLIVIKLPLKTKIKDLIVILLVNFCYIPSYLTFSKNIASYFLLMLGKIHDMEWFRKNN